MPMQAFYADPFVLPLPPGHRFPMSKYRLLREQLEDMPCLQLCQALPASDGELALAHTPSYLSAVVDGTLGAALQREIGFPWSEAMVERARRSVGATIAAARSALATGLATNVAGADPHEGDRLGRLKLTTAGLAERDRRVFAAARERRIPVALSMAGGYGRVVEDTVQVHLGTIGAAIASWQQWNNAAT